MLEISIEKFSGPLGLLLSLIEKEEMDITEISLAKIADEYVHRIKSAQDIPAEEMADFLLLAAKLLLIKSKALLPYLYSAEEEEEIDELERQLRMYKEFVAASEKVKTILGSDRRMFIAPFNRNRRQQFNLPVFSPPLRLDAVMLRDKFLALAFSLEKNREAVLPETTIEAQVNIDDKISLLKNLLLNKLKVNFSRLLLEADSRTEVIVSFLALLELAKQREIIFEQADIFSDIHISSLS